MQVSPPPVRFPYDPYVARPTSRPGDRVTVITDTQTRGGSREGQRDGSCRSRVPFFPGVVRLLSSAAGIHAPHLPIGPICPRALGDTRPFAIVLQETLGRTDCRPFRASREFFAEDPRASNPARSDVVVARDVIPLTARAPGNYEARRPARTQRQPRMLEF